MSRDPQLEFVFEAQVQIAPPIDFGVTRQGHRRVIPILSGEVEGPRLQGTVMEGGADWQILHTDGAADLEEDNHGHVQHLPTEEDGLAAAA